LKTFKKKERILSKVKAKNWLEPIYPNPLDKHKQSLKNVVTHSGWIQLQWKCKMPGQHLRNGKREREREQFACWLPNNFKCLFVFDVKMGENFHGKQVMLQMEI
jgi:hypothetical protein